MKTRKLAIAMLISASVVLTSTSSASAAMAAARPEQTLAVTRIDLNARNIVNPQHMIAEDPWDGKETVWIPIRDLQQVVKKIGFQTTWNGTDLTLTQYPANWTFSSPLGNPEAAPVVTPKNEMQISLVNSGPPSMNLPRIVASNPASGVDATYVPIFYIDATLTLFANLLARVWSVGSNDARRHE